VPGRLIGWAGDFVAVGVENEVIVPDRFTVAVPVRLEPPRRRRDAGRKRRHGVRLGLYHRLRQCGQGHAARRAGGHGTASFGSPVVTITRKSKGVRGNDGALYHDISQKPATTTFTLAGGSSLTGGGFRFTGGTGADNVTNVLAVLFPGTWDYIGIAQNDTTNLGKFKTQLQTKAGILEGRLEEAVFGATGSLGAATSLAQTTCNEFRMNCAWQVNAESHPSEIAAIIAAKRAVTEGTDPVHVYDDEILTGIAPNRAAADIPAHATLKSAINNSVTPLLTQNGSVKIVMLITTYSLNGASPDYRCLQAYYVSMPDYARIDVGLQYISSVKPANPRVQADNATSEKQPVAGVWTPSRAVRFMVDIQREYENRSWFRNVDTNLATAFFNDTANRIEGVFPCPVTPGDHQFGVSIRQIAS
jgi:phage tail sheath gpL-like